MYRRIGYFIGLLLLLVALPVSAQKGSGPRVQEFTGRIDRDTPVALYDLRNLQPGDIVYAYVEETSGGLDTYIALGDQTFSEVFREDDDGGGNYNSELEYVVQEAQPLSLAVTSYDENTRGDYRLVIGVNAPSVLNDGRANAVGEIFASYHGTTTRAALSISFSGISVTDCTTLTDRPSLSGAERTESTENFVLHYTESGEDAASSDYVQAVMAELEGVWNTEVSLFGWPAPPSDCGEGGDTRYDVYLMDTLNQQDALGFSMPEGVIGDNIHSPLVEQWASYSYLALENDFDDSRNAIALMRATLAHEFHHAIQFGYDLNDVGGDWYYEASATWMETQVFPEDEDATPYVGDVLDTPHLCLGALPQDSYADLRIYAEWLVMDSLAADYGMGAVRRLWELIADYEGMGSYYVLAEELGTTPEALVQRYGLRNLLRAYELGDEFRGHVRVEALVDGPGRYEPRQYGLEQLGVSYVLVTGPGVYTFEMAQPEISMTAVGVNTKQRIAETFELGPQGTIDTSPYQHFYIMLVNTQRHADYSECMPTQWVLNVQDGTPSNLLEAKLWYADNFTAAR